MFTNLNITWKYSIVVDLIICLLLLSRTILQVIAIIIDYAVIQKFICYYLYIKYFNFHMPWQFPFSFLIHPPPPPPLSNINCTTRTFKNICIYLLCIKTDS